MIGRPSKLIHNERGSYTAETAILVACAIAGLVAMTFYVKAALQGNVFSISSSIGTQYDPRDQYREDQRLDMTEEVYQQTALSMVTAHHLAQPPNSPFDPIPQQYVFDARRGVPNGDERRRRILESLPAGRVFREPSFQFSLVTADWESTSTSDYRDAR